MGLQGQQERCRPDAGYAMAALLVMIGVMAIVMTAVLPVWRHEAQREKEAELVFRGQQWVRAIRLYQSRFQTFPPSFDVLVSQRFIRKKFKDPITGEDFQPLYAAGQAGQRGAGPNPPGANSFASSSQGVVTGGGIIGVTSKSKDTSIRVYNGATHYNEWQFVYVNTAAGRGQFPGQGRPGFPGRGPGQQNPNNPGFPGGPGRGPGGPGRGPGGPGRGFGTPGVMPFPGMPPPQPPPGGRGGRGGG